MSTQQKILNFFLIIIVLIVSLSFVSISISCTPGKYRDTESYAHEQKAGKGDTAIGGYYEEDRKKIFIELIDTEKKADKEAMEEYPLDTSDPKYSEDNHEKYKTLKKELSDKYADEICKKYNLTSDEIKMIRNEGFAKDWLPQDY
ncbi:MAG: hypothetical protein M1475_08615 [Actinobacteria bacterium]|nr:hypothetical protein [Actinomycetota bacterium]MCL6088460.1 hypothetical protein [Actinomycetota bacterium]